MGSAQSGYQSVKDAIFYQNVKRDVENIDAHILELKKEGKPTHEEERVLDLALSELHKLESK